MNILRTAILATGAIFLASAGLASANGSSAAAVQLPVGSGWGTYGPAQSGAPYQPGTIPQPATHQTTSASGATAGGARADTCFVDQPVYDRAGKVIAHHTVDICAQ